MSIIDIDLYRDWITQLKSELSAYGYDTNQMQMSEVVAHTYLNLIKRLIKPVPRIVLKAQNFSCPPDLITGLTEIERKITCGEDLSSHLSRLLRKPTYNDPLLNDWGIHHIHLGATTDSDGFVKRTGSVLFVRFDNTNAYLIDVLSHGSWSQQRLVKELHDNWPDSIKHFRLNGVLGQATTFTDKDVAALRKANVNTVVDLGGGVIYAPIGGGFSTSGISTEVVIRSDRCTMQLHKMQETIIDNIDSIARAAKEQGANFPDSPRFELQFDGGNLYAVEVNSMVTIPLGSLAL